MLVLGIFSSFYTVKETEQAIITTLGAVTSVEGAGLHFKAPFGIQHVEKIQSNITRKMTIGYYRDTNDMIVPVDSESQMITSDYNIVDIDFFVEWKVSDPVMYRYSSNDPQLILKSLTQSAARSVISSQNVDNVLTTGKEFIQSEIEEKIRSTLQAYNIGIMLENVKIQDSSPPTEEVMNAFKYVETAKQEKETEINGALAYQNKQLPAAQSEADKIVKQAEGYKASRIQEAQGQVARFEEIYKEYSTNPNIAKTRMYLEAIEEIFPGMDIYVNTSVGGVNTMLPLDSFVNDKTSTPTKEGN